MRALARASSNRYIGNPDPGEAAVVELQDSQAPQGGEMRILDPYRQEIAMRLEEGFGLSEVERYLIEPAVELTDDERAALWLYAWSYHASLERGAVQYETLISP